MLCNVVDVPELCDFYYPAVVKRGALQIAISTGGESPALAQRLRKELDAQFGPEYLSPESKGGTNVETLSKPLRQGFGGFCLVDSILGSLTMSSYTSMPSDTQRCNKNQTCRQFSPMFHNNPCSCRLLSLLLSN